MIKFRFSWNTSYSLEHTDVEQTSLETAYKCFLLTVRFRYYEPLSLTYIFPTAI